MANSNKTLLKHNDNLVQFSNFRNAVDLFLANPLKSEIYNLKSHHREILRVIARYCDMPLKFCCLKQANLAKETGMGLRMLINCLAYLSQRDYFCKNEKMQGIRLIYTTSKGKLNHYRIGEIITGIPND